MREIVARQFLVQQLETERMKKLHSIEKSRLVRGDGIAWLTPWEIGQNTNPRLDACGDIPPEDLGRLSGFVLAKYESIRAQIFAKHSDDWRHDHELEAIHKTDLAIRDQGFAYHWSAVGKESALEGRTKKYRTFANKSWQEDS